MLCNLLTRAQLEAREARQFGGDEAERFVGNAVGAAVVLQGELSDGVEAGEEGGEEGLER